MTRKHFEALASAIKANGSLYGYTAALDDLAKHLAHICAQDNPNFNRKRFLAACGVPVEA